MNDVNKLTDLDELERVFEGSRRRPVWIFKHSLICPISTRAWEEFQQYVEDTGSTAADFTLIEIQRARPISAAVTERTGVRHESPQAILLVDGEPRWHASHSDITVRSLAEAADRI